MDLIGRKVAQSQVMAVLHPVIGLGAWVCMRLDVAGQFIGVAGLHLSVGVGKVDRSDHAMGVESRRHVARIPRPDTRLAAFGQSDWRVRSAQVGLCVEPNGSICGGFYLSPMTWSCSLSWPFSLT